MLSVVMDKSWGGPVAGVAVLLALLLFSSVASVCSLLVLWVLSVFGGVTSACGHLALMYISSSRGQCLSLSTAKLFHPSPAAAQWSRAPW